jgi:hypothetical protein
MEKGRIVQPKAKEGDVELRLGFMKANDYSVGFSSRLVLADVGVQRELQLKLCCP